MIKLKTESDFNKTILVLVRITGNVKQNAEEETNAHQLRGEERYRIRM